LSASSRHHSDQPRRPRARALTSRQRNRLTASGHWGSMSRLTDSSNVNTRLSE